LIDSAPALLGLPDEALRVGALRKMLKTPGRAGKLCCETSMVVAMSGDLLECWSTKPAALSRAAHLVAALLATSTWSDDRKRKEHLLARTIQSPPRLKLESRRAAAFTDSRPVTASVPRRLFSSAPGSSRRQRPERPAESTPIFHVNLPPSATRAMQKAFLSNADQQRRTEYVSATLQERTTVSLCGCVKRQQLESRTCPVPARHGSSVLRELTARSEG